MTFAPQILPDPSHILTHTNMQSLFLSLSEYRQTSKINNSNNNNTK